MQGMMKTVLYWAPRVLGLAFAAFLSIFALDVFGHGSGFWGTLLALLMHLIPTFLVLGALLIAWRREGIGALLFIALAAVYLLWAVQRLPPSAYAGIAGPLLLIALLFGLNRYLLK